MDDIQTYQEKYAVPNEAVVNNDSAESSAGTEKTSLFCLPQTEEEMRHCKHCEFQAEDWPIFSKHVFTPGHLKKLAQAYKIRLSTDQVSSTFTCDVCVVECHGHKPWVSHLLGAKHKKALEQIAIAKAEEKNEMFMNKTGGPMRNNQFGNMHNNKPYNRMQNTMPKPRNIPSVAAHDFAQYPEPLIGLEYLTEIQVAGQNPRYECSVCITKFDHNLKFPHLVGQKHRMNVLKIKRPVALKGVASKKRSEITSILARESIILEVEEGRQLVKTKVKDPPFSFNADYSQQNNAGRGATRGVRGAIRGGRGATRGGRGATRGGRGATRGGRGVSQGKTWDTRGGRGVGRGNTASRGTWSNRGMSQSGGYNFGQSSGSYPQSSAVPSGASSYNYDSYNSSYDSYGNVSYGNDTYGNNSSFDNSSNRGSYMESSSHGQTYPGQSQTYSDSASQFSGGGYSYSAQPPPQIPYTDNRSIPSTVSKEAETSPTKEGISAGLAGALGDLTKLVQNEDDASVALQVSNALTKALLQYRMGSETKTEN